MLGFGCVVKEFGLFLIFEFENLDEVYVVLLFGNLIVFVFIIIWYFFVEVVGWLFFNLVNGFSIKRYFVFCKVFFLSVMFIDLDLLLDFKDLKLGSCKLFISILFSRGFV